MPFVKAQCTNCGAILDVDSFKDAAVCPYCDTPYVVEKAINNYTTNITNNISAHTVNIINQKDGFEIVAGVLKKYNGRATDIIIPDEVVSIEEEAFPNGITSVIIRDTCKLKCLRGFKNLTSLNKVSIGNGVTEIYESAFENCSALISVTIPGGVTKIGNFAFKNCYSLTHVLISYGVIEIGCGSFKNDSSLVDVTIPDSITNIGVSAFQNCRKLTNITIPNNVTNISDYAFENCSMLTHIKISNRASAICSSAFKDCLMLTNFSIPDSVNVIYNNAFENCSSLTSLTIPSSVAMIGDFAFSNCLELTSVTISNGVISIGDYAFACCFKLTKVVIPDSVNSIGEGAFPSSTETNSILKNNEKVKKSGCYVATCVYGSYDCPQVWTLRRYRDNILGKKWYGRVFIRTYYTFSPVIVKWFGKASWFKKMWRGKLDKIVKCLNEKGINNTPYQDRQW